MLGHAGVHLRIEEAEGIAPVVLGPVHGGVGVFQQGVEIRPVLRVLGDTQGAGDRDVHFVQVDRLHQRRQQLADGGRHRIAVTGLVENDQELVAALPAHAVAAADCLFQAPRHLLQYSIAGDMTEGVVDGLEVVQIEKQHRHRPLLASGIDNRMLAAVARQHPVGQAGQRIMMGEKGNLLLRLAHPQVLRRQARQGPVQVRGHQPGTEADHGEDAGHVDKRTQAHRRPWIDVPALQVDQRQQAERGQHKPQQGQ